MTSVTQRPDGATPGSATRSGHARAPESFRLALRQLRQARPRSEVRLHEIAAPARQAPWAVALAADVHDADERHHQDHVPPRADSALPVATGRFVLLHDPAGKDHWQGAFRVVTYIKAALELDVAQDPMVSEVAWTWLVEALELRHAQYTHAGGTATRVLAESFGTLAERADATEIEMRASWTPRGADECEGGLGAHLEAWAEMVCAFAGLPPQPDGVRALPLRRETEHD